MPRERRPSATKSYVRDATTNRLTAEALMAQATAERRPYLLVIDGPTMGKIYLIGSEGSTIGRSRECEIVIDDDRVSRKHAKVSARDPETGQVVVTDLGSTNGMVVNGKKTLKAVLADGDRVRVGGTTLKLAMQDELEEKFQTSLYDSATRDPLTGSYNKRFFNETLKTDFAWSQRHGRPLALLMIDVDHFKAVNDKHGHPTGDAVLKHLATQVQGLLREEDILSRYGGEEFAVILRDTEPDKAQMVAERVRTSVAKTPIVHGANKVSITVSIGVATLRGQTFKNRNELVKAADDCLYKAKATGRNRVVCHVTDDHTVRMSTPRK